MRGFLNGYLVATPGGAGHTADRLTVAQQPVARAKCRSTNRERKRATVPARHRKIANQRKDFHHKQARTGVGRYEWWWRT